MHFSADEATATAVGQRHGKPIVLTVEAGRMHAQGFVFYQAANGVWLTESVYLPITACLAFLLWVK
ncbi:RNA 2'-phosphotransferase [Kosakonia oryzae]|nr:RNA 2'-phosphotransferase [Kosakonia oryzae]UDJ83602.1 RNA 2'-phosphotransferase [Kosakonia oryzae]